MYRTRIDEEVKEVTDMYERKIRILQEDVETEKTENSGEDEQLRQELEEAKQEIEQLKADATTQEQHADKEGQTTNANTTIKTTTF